MSDDGPPTLSNSTIVTIDLNPLNDNVPIGVGEDFTVTEGGSVNVLDSGDSSVLDNDTDADLPADTLVTVLDDGPDHASSFTLNADGTFLYVHDGSEPSTDSFTYHLFDGHNNSAPVVVTVDIIPVNDAPHAANDTYTIDEADTLITDIATGVLANDTDAEGDLLSAGLDSGPSTAR